MRIMLVKILCCVALAKATDKTYPHMDHLVSNRYVLKNVMIPKVTKSNSRIIGGNEAVPNSIPYIAALFTPISAEEDDVCGGSLITEQTVLTAAHCLVSAIGPIFVKLGAHNRRIYEPTQQNFSSSKYHIHKGYLGDKNKHAHDIAVISLPSPAKLNKYVQLIPLAKDPSQDYEQRSAIVSGWGRTSNTSEASDILKTVTVPVIANSVCNVAYLNAIRNSHLCTSSREGDACGGDSGGPLVLKDVQIGIVSFGAPDDCLLGNWPSAYTRVTSYLDWINEHSINYKL